MWLQETDNQMSYCRKGTKKCGILEKQGKRTAFAWSCLCLLMSLL